MCSGDVRFAYPKLGRGCPCGEGIIAVAGGGARDGTGTISALRSHSRGRPRPGDVARRSTRHRCRRAHQRHPGGGEFAATPQRHADGRRRRRGRGDQQPGDRSPAHRPRPRPADAGRPFGESVAAPEPDLGHVDRPAHARDHHPVAVERQSFDAADRAHRHVRSADGRQRRAAVPAAKHRRQQQRPDGLTGFGQSALVNATTGIRRPARCSCSTKNGYCALTSAHARS